MEAVKQAALVKPVVVVKSGRSSMGQRAAMSHTGAMAGSDAVFDAALKQCGAIRVDTLKELFEVCKGFSLMPPMEGRKIAIVTNSGGPGVMTTDRVDKLNMQVPETSPEIRTALAEFLPAYAGMKNPVDITVEGTGEQYGRAAQTMLQEMDGSVVIYVGTPYLQSMPVAEQIVASSKSVGKPVCAVMQVGTDVTESIAYLQANGIPCYEIGEDAAFVLEKMAAYSEWKQSAGDAPVSLPQNRRASCSKPRIVCWNRRQWHCCKRMAFPFRTMHLSAPERKHGSCCGTGYRAGHESGFAADHSQVGCGRCHSAHLYAGAGGRGV